MPADMKGYDREKAAAYILKRLDPGEFKRLAPKAAMLTRDAIDADMAYMRFSGVIDDEGMMGDAFYDDDDAFEHILAALESKYAPTEADKRALCSFVDQFMELEEAYLTEAGLIDWE